jgi:hypothetical protein
LKSVGTSLVVGIFGLGGGLLGFWLVARFPRLGPQTITASLVAVAAVFILQSPVPALTARVVSTFGVRSALLGVVLPSLTLLFWTAGCLVRSLVATATAYRR